MATYVARAKAIIDAVIDGTATNAQKQRIADAVIIYRKALLKEVAADPLSPTGEEKAEVFVRAVREWGQAWLFAGARKASADGHKATDDAAGDAAAGDL